MSKQTVNLSLSWELDNEKGVAKTILSSPETTKSLQFIQGFMVNEDGKIASKEQNTALCWLLEHFMKE